MIPTTTLRTWLRTTLEGVAGLKRVGVHAQADLENALSHFRDTSQNICIVVPDADQVEHDYEADLVFPLRSRVSSVFHLLFSGRRLDRLPEGDTATLDLKDAILDLFLTTAVSDVEAHCTVTASEPITIQLDDNQGRDAWKLTITIRPLT